MDDPTKATPTKSTPTKATPTKAAPTKAATDATLWRTPTKAAVPYPAAGAGAKCQTSKTCDERNHEVCAEGRCACAGGFRRDPQSGKCKDINECQEQRNLCPLHAHCRNTIGSYDCPCNKGYTRHGGFH